MTRNKKLIIITIVLAVIAVGLIVFGLARRASNSSGDNGTVTYQPATEEQRIGEIVDFVQRFYAQYTATPDSGSTVDDQHQLALNGFGSGDAIDSFMSEEKQCTSNAPTSVTVNGVAQVGNAYQTDVVYHYAQADDQNLKVNVLEDGNAYVIDEISCSSN